MSAIQGYLGRKATLTPSGDGPPLTALRTKGVTINNEPVDITSDDDNGFRRLLDEPGVRSIDIACEGVTKDGNLLAIAAGTQGAVIKEYVLDIPGIGQITGDFYIGSLELQNATPEAATFSCTLQSSGEFTYEQST